MGRPKLPEFTAQDVDDYGHLKAQAADILKKLDALKKKLSNQKLIAKKVQCFQ